MRNLWILGGVLAACAASAGEIVHKNIEYKDGDTVLEGYAAWPKNASSKLKAILIVHDWNGIDGYETGRADQLAKLGYFAFCADIYGKGVRPATVEACGKESSKYYQNPAQWRSRLTAALSRVTGSKLVDSKKVVAIGYCFGGTAVLEMARHNMPVVAVASFHGNLEGPTRATNKVKPRVLVMTGAADPFVPAKQVDAFRNEMSAVNAKFKIVTYSGAGHAFTVPDSGKWGLTGVSYQKNADMESWKEFMKFLHETLP